jgi:hypothetical protein
LVFCHTDVLSFDRSFLSFCKLVDERPLKDQLPASGVKHQISVVIDLDTLGTFKSDPDLCRIAARRDNQVIFQMPLVAVIDEVDARIDCG